MFAALGRTINHAWILILAAWLGLFFAARAAAPPWRDVIQDGQFSFLPAGSPSRRADDLFNAAFPHDLLASSIVIVVARERESGLESGDLQFITEDLKPRLQKLATLPVRHDERTSFRGAKGDNKTRKESSSGSGSAGASENTSDEPLIARVRAFDDKGAGALLMSRDRHATLVILELTKDFASQKNQPVIEAVESLIGDFRQQDRVPADLLIELTGSAVVGLDIARASAASARAIGIWTIVLVTALTLIVFRAPLLALIPLITLFFAMDVALNLLALLSGAGLIGLFQGVESYSTVVVYASGVDYSLFLISRFREELEGGSQLTEGVGNATGKVGAAIAASAATEIAGIGMMAFAQFGKFHEAGIAIAFSLFVMLLAVLSLTPALLRLAGAAAFWPHGVAIVSAGEQPGFEVPREDRFHRIWEKVADAVLRRPATFWLISTAVLVPFAVIGVLRYNHLNYDLNGNLPRNAESARGMTLLERYFAAGAVGPVNLLIQDDSVDFRTPDGFELLKSFTERLNKEGGTLGIAGVRSVSAPVGATAAAAANHGGLAERLVTTAAVRRIAEGYFVTSNESFGGHVARFELELKLNPFSEQAMDVLDRLEEGVRQLLPDDLQKGSTILYNGSTASLRDLKNVGARDRTRINVLVVACVFVILVILLRRVVLTAYLLLTVLLSYLVTLGVTFLVFQWLDPQGFPGLDWTVPLFLFTVLIAIGEDYNILLVTRVHEEQVQAGAERGIAIALARTGPIISSCGFIMAGTFLSLSIAGQLAQMIQLGFALAFGVLLDTFVVRPILVPSYLLLVNRIPSASVRRLLGT